MRKIFAAVFCLGLGVATLASAAPAKTGEQLYKRCSACHLDTGEGVPGSYPAIAGRLKPLAVSEAGREYLVLVLKAGLMGPLTVDGVSYSSMMPAQAAALKEGGIAKVLNYVMEDLNGFAGDENWTPFTEEEVKTILGKNPKVRARDVLQKRADVFGSE
ncbi:c-type cytochrome [Emcibacter sp.]|uniref:c-type cytochrome n=1 Tax=Emcibacter sp. TaxID=1979954 RepID=UPI002AA8E812|nr:c-type cytochrome [Emcibacter sp.]